MTPKDQLSSDCDEGNNNAPSWLTEDYFKDILEKEFKNFKITNFEANIALQSGENYASKMYRVKIELDIEGGKQKKISYVVKHLPKGNPGFDMVEKMGLFPKEMEMYSEIIPKFEKIFREVGKEVKFSPRYLKATNNPKLIVLEDLKTKNFVNINRLEGMDLTHVKAVLQKVAQFHAASVCLYAKNGPYSKRFNECFFNSEIRTEFSEVDKNISQIYEDCMRKWKDGPKYVEKVSALRKDYISKIIDCLKIDPNEFNVLNHGDLWSNNIMFQYDEEGKIKEIYFVDLQMCKWGSPTQDLQYLLISSCNHEIKVKEFDYLVKYYHDHLIKNLELLQYPRPFPKLRDLHCQILRRGYFAVSSALGVMSAVLLDPTEDASIDNYIGSNEESNKFKEAVFMNPRYVREMEMLLPFFENRGLLD